MPSIAKQRRQRKTAYKRYAAVVVPVLVFFIFGSGAVTYYIATRIVKPDSRPVLNTPLNYEQLLQKPIWDNKKWVGAGGLELNGWLLYRERPAPFVITVHGFNQNREELLNPSFEIWKAGYNVLACDLRAHGENLAKTSTLGPMELDDLKSTIQYVKTLKTESGVPLCDGRVGLYGADLSGFVALSAAATDDSVKAIAVDTVYPSQSDFVKLRSKTILGSPGPRNSAVIENAFLQSCIGLCLSFVTDRGGTPPMTASEAIAAIGDRPLLLIAGKSNASLYPLAQEVSASSSKAQKLEYDRSRSGASLFRQDAENYDRALVDFFVTAPGFEPPPVDEEMSKAVRESRIPPSTAVPREAPSTPDEPEKK
jgi:pimeloyl-ACP methyl ester carboxylesterase